MEAIKEIGSAKPSLEIFRENLIYLMNAKGVSRAKLSNDLGISFHRVEQWMRCVCFPKHDMMVALCNYLGYFDIYKMLTTRIG